MSSSDRTYADFRSASRAKQRDRKHRRRYDNFRSLAPADLPTCPDQQSHYLPSCIHPSCPLRGSTYGTYDTCGHWCRFFFPADLSNAPVATFTPHEAYLEAQHSRLIHNHHSGKQRCNRSKRTWATARGRKADAEMEIAQFEEEFTISNRIDMVWDMEWIEELANRDWEGGNWSEWCMQLGATWEDVRSWEPWSEIGETFPRWAQRRINEMRQVKEDRLRRERPLKDPMSALSDKCSKAPASVSGQRASHKDAKIGTTMPTTPEDVAAHEALNSLLNPPRRKSRRWASILKYPVHGFWWFDEYVWYWHRNMSGCFELTSWIEHSNCFCELYAPCGQWSPEDHVQPYTLGELIVSSCENGQEGGEEVGSMYEDVKGMHAAEGMITEDDGESKEVGEYNREALDDGWEVVPAVPPPLSTASSWSVVDGENGMQMQLALSK